MNKNTLRKIASPLSAFFSTTCCWGPALLSVLGIGGVAVSLKFARYRIFFLPWAGIMLGLNFYWVYFKTTPGMNESPCCLARRTRTKKRGLWFTTVIVAAFLLYPYWGQWWAGRPVKTNALRGTAYQEINLQVNGMVCGACTARVKKGLQTIRGVKTAVVSFDNKQARLFITKDINPDEVRRTSIEKIESMGFQIE